ncbi:RET [Branchiostoma lanceolatum]|uniref:RET protein n=1 Tax=Branchiostoma lanceolatum TaxID=7740 RepID=A0A8J9Z836_BRALA|nr:RET [Branchiostoma lanceolatum]
MTWLPSLFLRVLVVCTLVKLGGSAPTGKLQQQAAVAIAEDLPIGSVVADLKGFWHEDGYNNKNNNNVYELLTGDDFKRFHIDNSNGKILVKNPLEFKLKSSSAFVPSINDEENGFYYCVVNTTDGRTLEAEFLLNASRCASDYHGKFCNETCDCYNDGRCDRMEGCLCLPGWMGASCDSPCPEGYFGQDCTTKCTCENAAKCDRASGTCSCLAGWYGSNCEQPCPLGRYGPSCVYGCKCEQNTTCDVFNGTCDSYDITKTSLFSHAWLTAPVVALVLVFVAICCYLRRRLKVHRKTNKLDEVRENIDDDDEKTQLLLPWERDEKHLRVIRMIGQGTFGHVVLAQLKRPGKQNVLVAVKTLQGASHTAMCYKDFYRETDILAALYNSSEYTVDDKKAMHPNIVGLYGVITQSEPKRILLEYAPRGDLLQYLRRNRDNPRASSLDFLGLAVDVARGLQELERVKIVHRDVAARNVLVTEQNTAKIADFGLARDVYTNTEYVHVKQGAGVADLLPLKWMSLESIRDGVYTSYSDVWSFGVLLWEIVTFGEEPHYPDMLRPDCRRLLNLLKLGTRLEKPENCPEVLYRLMSRCWDAEASQRPLAEELEVELTAIVPQEENEPMNRAFQERNHRVERETAL